MWDDERFLGVIADDLTGACDTGCQFCRYGWDVQVTHYSQLRPDCEARVMVVNTESRKSKISAAQRTVFEIAKDLMRANRIPFYKKIDSTLKGNWSQELQALVRASHPDVVLVAPAFPSWGRTTEEGLQCVNGQPVSDKSTHFSGVRRKSREGTANLVTILQQIVGDKVQLIRRPVLRKGPRWIEKQIEMARSRGYPYLVFDVSADEDLKNVCLAGCALEQKVLWVGSAGLARFLPLGWGRHVSEDSYPINVSTGRVLLVNGSFNPVNTEQLRCLCESRPVALLMVDDEDSVASQSVQTKLSECRQLIEEGRDVVLGIRLNKPVRSGAQLQQLHDTLQYLAMELVQTENIGGLIVVGGDTAMKIYRNLGADGIRIGGEIQPGISWGYWIGGLLDKRLVVTKAGGFGQADTLLRAMDFLRKATT